MSTFLRPAQAIVRRWVAHLYPKSRTASGRQASRRAPMVGLLKPQKLSAPGEREALGTNSLS